MYQQHGQRPGGFPHKKKGNPVITRFPPPPGYVQPGFQHPSPQQQGYQHPGSQQPGYQPQWSQGQQSPGPVAQQPYPYPNQGYQQQQHPPQQQQTQGYPPQPPYGTHPQGPTHHHAQSQPVNLYGYYQQPSTNQYASNVMPQQPPIYPQQSSPYPQQQQQQQQHYPQHRNSSSYTNFSPTSTFSPAYSNYVSASPQSAHSSQSATPFQNHQAVQNGPNHGQTYPPQTHGQGYPTQPHPRPQRWSQTNAHGQDYEGLGGVYQDEMGIHASVPHVDDELPPCVMPRPGRPIFAPEDDHIFWDFENSVGAFWPKSGDYVNPRYSTGVQVWRSAQRVTRPLPSTWKEAAEQAQAAPKEPLNYKDSVSVYFTPENAHESELDIRQTDLWPEIKNYSEFDELHIPRQIVRRTKVKEEPSIMDSLDQALNTSSTIARPLESSSLRSHSTGKAQHQPSQQERRRSSCITDQWQPSALGAAQEEILARLGVSGPAKPSSAWTSAIPVPPPPPPPEPEVKRSPSIDPWAENGARRSASRLSNGSHNTIAGSDFNPGDNDSPKADTIIDGSEGATCSTATTDASRKRSRGSSLIPYAASDLGRNQEGDGGRQVDDGGRRKRPKLNGRNASVYGRR